MASGLWAADSSAGCSGGFCHRPGAAGPAHIAFHSLGLGAKDCLGRGDSAPSAQHRSCLVSDGFHRHAVEVASACAADLLRISSLTHWEGRVGSDRHCRQRHAIGQRCEDATSSCWYRSLESFDGVSVRAVRKVRACGCERWLVSVAYVPLLLVVGSECWCVGIGLVRINFRCCVGIGIIWSIRWSSDLLYRMNRPRDCRA